MTAGAMKKERNASVLFSHAEFDALPHSVQRKYFSSLERLRIAEQQSLEEAQCFSAASHRSSHSVTRSIGTLHDSLTRRRSRQRKVEAARHAHEVAQQEVEFFLSLPPKARNFHFSLEEQVLLLGRCEPAVVPSTHDHDDVTSHEQPFDDFRFGFYDDSEDSQHRGRSRRRSISPFRDLHRHDTRVTALTSRSLQQLDTMTPPLSHQSLPQRPAHFRRTMSMSHVPARHSTSSAPPMIDLPFMPFAPLRRPLHQRSISLSQSGRRTSHIPAPPIYDPEATHYQDPEARKKLRMFLASAQKFDEAVEFGFPSSAGDDTIAPRYQLPPITTDARNFSRDMQTFLRDDKMSFLEDDEDEGTRYDTDGESVTDMESPVTPSSVGVPYRGHMRHVSPSNLSSQDSTGLPPFHPMHNRLNREMTLRMTLTRPDLRADEEALYGWQNQKTMNPRDDPFALEELQLSDDMTGSKSPFAVKPKQQGNLVSRLFKRASKKGR